MYNTTKHPNSETFIVAKGDQSFKTAGSLYPTSGNSLTLADGQLGIVSWDTNGFVGKGSFLSATNGPSAGANTVADVASIKIIQGTPDSNALNNLNAIDAAIDMPPYVSSVEIKGKNKISFVGRAAATPLLDAHLITDFATTDFQPQVLRVAFESVRSNKWNGIHNQPNVMARTASVDYATLGLGTDAAVRDYVVRNLVSDLNTHSQLVRTVAGQPTGRHPFVALGIDISGGSGTALSAVAAGTPINFITRGGVNYSVTPDASFVATITEAIANSTLATTSTIEVIDVNTAGTADAILLVALEEQQARVQDTEPRRANRINVTGNAFMGSQGVAFTIASRATEGEGQGRYYNLKYTFRANLQNWSREWAGMTTTFLQKYNFVDPTQEYNVFIIESFDSRKNGSTVYEQFPASTYILVPSTSGASAANTLADLNAILAPWLNSATDITKDTTATAPALFV